MKLRVRVWDKRANEYLAEDDFSIAIGLDGKVYEYDYGSNYSGAWLTREDVSDQYEVHFEDEEDDDLPFDDGLLPCGCCACCGCDCWRDED